MRKWKAALLLILLCCCIPLYGALASTGKVTASSLNMRAQATTDSDVVKVLKKGTTVTIQSTKGSWYKVTAGGKTGYVAKKYIEVSSSSSAKSTSSSSSSSSKSSSTTSATASSDGTCSYGDKGSAVKAVQKRLKTLGYLSGSVDGDYGSGTKKAVIAFQKNNGLKQTGNVNSATLKALNSSSAKKASAAADSGSGSSSGSTTTEALYWFSGGNKVIPKKAIFQVKDIKTGIVFKVRRWSGGNHIDAEPASASDAAKMKKIYGHWSWKRRSVLVKYNGHVYAASINGMPHGTQTIYDNDFAGHFCIHFFGSKTHGTKRVDETHQNCVKQAMKYSW